MNIDNKSHIFEQRRARLQQIVDEFGTQKELAEAVGIADSIISRMLYPEGKKNKRNIGEVSVRKIEEGLGKAHGWFDGIINDNETLDNKIHTNIDDNHKADMFGLSHFKPNSTKQYPLISWGDVSLWFEKMTADVLPRVTLWLPSVRDYGDKAFWLEVRDDTMAGSTGVNYPKGSLILVEPYDGQQLKSGEKVIAKKIGGSDSDLTFKFFYEDGGKKWLRAAMPGYPHLAGEEYKIIGIVVGAWVD